MKSNAMRLGACLILASLASPAAANDIFIASAYPDWSVQVDGGPVQTNPTITLIRGETYNFNVSGLFSGFHTFYIKTAISPLGEDAYAGSGLSENGISSDTTALSPITFTVPQDAPDTLYYVCGNHSTSMAGTIMIDGVFRNGFELP